MIITIDGPAGSGKSTVARKLANKLGFIHLNSGALYRAVGLRAEAEGVHLEDECSVLAATKKIDFRFELVSKISSSGEQFETQFWVDGRDISALLDSASAGVLASKVAVLPLVRDVLVEVQRRHAKNHSVVLEGRDAGTVVFPDADIKFYLEAPLEVRARRRFEQLQDACGEAAPQFEAVKDEIRVRDERDSTRVVAPQKPAHDAVMLETGELSADQVVAIISEHILKNKRK